MSSTSSRGSSSFTQKPPVIHQDQGQSSDSDSYHTRSSSEYHSGSDMSGHSSNAHTRGQPLGETVRYRDPDDKRKYIEAKETRNSKGRLVNVIEHGESKGHYDPDEPSSREAHAAQKQKRKHEKKSSH